MWTASGECSDFCQGRSQTLCYGPELRNGALCIDVHNVVHDRVLLCHARDVDRLRYICTYIYIIYIYTYTHIYMMYVRVYIYICTCMSTVTMYMRQLLWWFQDRLEESTTAVFSGAVEPNGILSKRCQMCCSSWKSTFLWRLSQRSAGSGGYQ